MRGLAAPAIKSLVFIVTTALATAVLALTIMNGSGNGGTRYSAIFTSATSVNVGDEVRMAGVRVGQVSSLRIVHRREAKVGFTIRSDIRLAPTVQATIRFRNLLGQRYLSLDEGAGSLDAPLHPGAVIPLERTTPALDLTTLFNGFQPLFQALDPKQVNLLSQEIIAVFQGEGPTLTDLLDQVAVFTTSLSRQDQVIGELIDNLDQVLGTVNRHGGQVSSLVATLAAFVGGLSDDRAALGQAVTGIDGLTREVGDLLAEGRPVLNQSIDRLGRLAGNLSQSSEVLNSFLNTLPGKLDALGRTASYGSWLNFYLCAVSGRLPVPGDYHGGVGVQPTAERCR